VTCKCRRTPRVNPGCGSTTTVRVCRCHLPPSTGRSTHRYSLNHSFLSLQYHLTTPHPSTSTTAASQSRPNGTPCTTAVLLYLCITHLGSSHIGLHVSIPLSPSHSRPQHHFTASQHTIPYYHPARPQPNRPSVHHRSTCPLHRQHHHQQSHGHMVTSAGHIAATPPPWLTRPGATPLSSRDACLFGSDERQCQCCWEAVKGTAGH
jgi:hypothetical protein